MNAINFIFSSVVKRSISVSLLWLCKFSRLPISNLLLRIFRAMNSVTEKARYVQ